MCGSLKVTVSSVVCLYQVEMLTLLIYNYNMKGSQTLWEKRHSHNIKPSLKFAGCFWLKGCFLAVFLHEPKKVPEILA